MQDMSSHIDLNAFVAKKYKSKAKSEKILKNLLLLCFKAR